MTGLTTRLLYDQDDRTAHGVGQVGGGDVHSRNNIPAAIRPDQASTYGRLTMTGE